MSEPAVQSGRLRHTVVIERHVNTGTGSRGQAVGEWQAAYSSVAAEVTPLSGRQLEITRQLVATATHTIRIRYRPGILPGMRVVFRDRTFAVGHVGDGDMKLHYLDLTTTEQQTGAT